MKYNECLIKWLYCPFLCRLYFCAGVPSLSSVSFHCHFIYSNSFHSLLNYFSSTKLDKLNELRITHISILKFSCLDKMVIAFSEYSCRAFHLVWVVKWPWSDLFCMYCSCLCFSCKFKLIVTLNSWQVLTQNLLFSLFTGRQNKKIFLFILAP